MIWSIAPDLSWAYLNRGAVYVGVRAARPGGRGERAGAGAGRGGRARGAALRRRLLGAPRQGVPVAVPGRRAGGAAAEPDRLLERARARLCALALPLGLWIATRRSWRRELRAAGVVLLYLAVDRAGAHVLAGGDPRRRRRGAALARVRAGAARELRRARRLGRACGGRGRLGLDASGLVDDGQSLAARRSRTAPGSGSSSLLVGVRSSSRRRCGRTGSTGASTTRRRGGCGRGGSGSGWARSQLRA